MTPLQSFNIVDRLTKALSLIDETTSANQEFNSYMMWFEYHEKVRSLVLSALDTAKHIEIES
jgi:hypothetical protein